jgi:K+-transporting ATPase KdpF subunit
MPAIGSRGHVMTFDYSLAAVVSLGLLIYLTYALLRPEQF